MNTGQGNTTRTVLIVLAGVLGLGAVAAVLCCGGCVLLFRNAAAEAPQAQLGVEAFLDRVAAGESAEAYEENTTRAFKSSVSKDQFDGFLASLPPDVSRQARKITFARFNTINGVSLIAFRVLSNGKSCTVTVRKEGDRWKVQKLDVP